MTETETEGLTQAQEAALIIEAGAFARRRGGWSACTANEIAEWLYNWQPDQWKQTVTLGHCRDLAVREKEKAETWKSPFLQMPLQNPPDRLDHLKPRFLKHWRRKSVQQQYRRIYDLFGLMTPREQDRFLDLGGDVEQPETWVRSAYTAAIWLVRFERHHYACVVRDWKAEAEATDTGGK